ncbi:hypothetical protein ABT186_01965 [Streptomyces sp. NPDC001634]|uniref:hypothetical protein n=1 Tax=Streptomyces sp. NPDC001634 TaxID=3154390 RepID=UPI003325DAA5
MSARDELDHYLTFSGHGPQKRKALIDAFAHELAEQQRMWALDYVGDGDNSSYDYTYAVTLGAKLAADLIDPGAGPARPDEEPTP